MRFFTPELYVRFNSADEGEADQANTDWEMALSEYRNHLDGIRDRLPNQAKMLTELCLHDAELLACDQVAAPALAIVSVKHEARIVSLIYLLSERIRENPAPQHWPFSKAHTHWLYDEVDLASGQQDSFVHRVLLSDGRVLEIPFVSAFVQSVPLSSPAESISIRQSA